MTKRELMQRLNDVNDDAEIIIGYVDVKYVEPLTQFVDEIIINNDDKQITLIGEPTL